MFLIRRRNREFACYDGSVYTRKLQIQLPPRQSTFLWGPRKVGKSTMLEQQFPGSIRLDMLDSDLRYDLIRRPALLRQILAANRDRLHLPVIIDEVQKAPGLLDEVQLLIESQGVSFVLCGSSARKLRRGQANLLGGRAWRFELCPLVTAEVPDFDLFRALDRGLIPAHYDSEYATRSIEAFATDYLHEEVAAEALTRSLAAFARFLELLGIMNGEMVNYAKTASEVGVDAKSIRGYFEILADTMIGRLLQPLPQKPGSRKNLVATPKFYLFDPGLARVLRKVELRGLSGADAGHLFETFLMNEIFGYRAYLERKVAMHFYRTKAGAEVDFVLDQGKLAIEAKVSDGIRNRDLAGMNSFLDEYPEARAIVVCLESRRRVVENDGRRIEITPWRDFCAELWRGEIF